MTNTVDDIRRHRERAADLLRAAAVGEIQLSTDPACGWCDAIGTPLPEEQQATTNELRALGLVTVLANGAVYLTPAGEAVLYPERVNREQRAVERMQAAEAAYEELIELLAERLGVPATVQTTSSGDDEESTVCNTEGILTAVDELIRLKRAARIVLNAATTAETAVAIEKIQAVTRENFTLSVVALRRLRGD